jgi:hypothetical protein
MALPEGVINGAFAETSVVRLYFFLPEASSLCIDTS